MTNTKKDDDKHEREQPKRPKETPPELPEGYKPVKDDEEPPMG